MESPSRIDSTARNPPKEPFTTYSPPTSAAPSDPERITSTQQAPPPATSTTPQSSRGSKTTTITMSSPTPEDPSVTTDPETTTQDPVTTETEAPVTTTEPPETPAITTTDAVSPTAATSTGRTSDRPATTDSTPPRTSSFVITITSTPYTTRYITTMSIVTIKTIVPKPTMVSGSPTTIFIPLTTTVETPTVVPDPSQPPPGGVSNANDKKSMTPWQVVLIVAACLIVAAAGSAVFLIGRIKKRRRERDAQQHFKFQEQQHPHQKEVMFGIGRGDESVVESSVTDASGAMSNRTLISPGEGGGGVYDTGGASAGGLRGWMDRFRSWTPWDSYREYRGPAPLPGGGHGPAGRLWLMEEDAELGSNDPRFADMRPISYQNEDYARGVAFAQHRQYQQQPHQGYHDLSLQGQQGSPGQAIYPLPPLSPSSRMSSASATTAHSNHNINEHIPTGTSTNASSSPSLLHPLLEERASIGSDHVDGRAIVSHRASLDSGVLAVNDRTSMYVDPATLEPHSMCEHIRKAPQALPDSDSQSNRAADAGERQDSESREPERANEEAQESGLVDAGAILTQKMAPREDGEASDMALGPHTGLKHTASLETRRDSMKQAQAAVPTVDPSPTNIVIEKRLQGNSVHGEPDDVFYMCPESPIGTTAPDDSQVN
ncbi:hypothetical protein EC968_000423 [Mortierella alpina]|nr:hypothetical protein EC968_000423 [Mortierella alpina]